VTARGAPARVRRLTADLPGIGGRLRDEVSDFAVEEVPLYEPAGEGDHAMFLLEKRGLSTFESLLWVSKAVRVSEHRIGYAGLKDARAVTTQWMSAPRVPPERVLALRHPRLRVLRAERHPHPVRIGHLRGNRFSIVVRGARDDRLPAAREALARLAARGVPNAYGPQRFGVKSDGHEMGRALLRGDYEEFLAHLLGRPGEAEHDPRVRAARLAYDRGDLERALALFPMKHRVQKRALSERLRTGSAEAAFRALGKRPRRIYVSAWQSWIFNRCLDERLARDAHDRLLPGDVAFLHDEEACYRVESEAAEAARARSLRASPTGPLPGHDLRRAGGVEGEVEARVLDEEGFDEAAFRAKDLRTRGGRRPFRVPLGDPSVERLGPGEVRVRFSLPPGSFGTVVLDELMKGDPPEGDATDDATGDEPEADPSEEDGGGVGDRS
jgi:tRNA pseudouridine13 synthase